MEKNCCPRGCAKGLLKATCRQIPSGGIGGVLRGCPSRDGGEGSGWRFRGPPSDDCTCCDEGLANGGGRRAAKVSDLLETATAAHGGLRRWNSLRRSQLNFPWTACSGRSRAKPAYSQTLATKPILTSSVRRSATLARPAGEHEVKQLKDELRRTRISAGTVVGGFEPSAPARET